MADKPLQSITFPGLTDKYTIPAVDNTLSVTGAAADAKKTGDEITNLKADLNDIDDRTSTGIVTYTKDRVINGAEILSRHTLYQIANISIGTTTFADISTATSSGAYAFKIPISGAKNISYPIFKSTGYFGCFMFDKNNVVIWGYSEATADTGTIKSAPVPENADWFLLSVPESLTSLSWNVVIEYPVLNSFMNSTEMRFGVTYTKAQARDAFVQYSTNRLYQNNNVVIGTTTLEQIPYSTSNGAYALIVDVSDADFITYPVFKSSGYFGSFILDANNVVIWAHDEKNLDTGSLKTIKLPVGSVRMLLSISSSLNLLNWSVSMIKSTLLYESSKETEETETPFEDSNRNMCLAGIKTDILTNKIPYHRGFLFHKLQNDDGSLWYGSDFRHINRIGNVSFSPSLMRFAISPKDGRIIATQRDARNGLWIWDGTNETRLNGFTANPMGWLYNSGVDFINDGSDEYCIFAEYNGTIVSNRDLYVWRGKYPYTSASDWEIVFTQTQQTDISHFHMVRRDPWTNILYLTAGDSSSESKWWYSTDNGENWTLLVSGTETGWGNSICRTINFVFTSDYVYWATDHGANEHALYRIARNASTGILDLSTKEKLTDLPPLCATNTLCYVESPNGLFMYDRIDTESSSIFGQPITMKFWNFETEQLEDIVSLGFTESTWGGSRGKCYVNYTNTKQPYPAMGFSIDTPCIFDLVCDNPSNIGTISYDVGSKTVRTVDY